MSLLTWPDTHPPVERPESPGAPVHAVELIGLNARVSGLVRTGSFDRLSDFVSAQPGALRLQDALLLNRRGQPTSDLLTGLRVRLEEITVIGERAGWAPVQKGAEDVYVEKRRERGTLLTRSHIAEATISLYPGASAAAYLEALDPPFLPVLDLRLRWLADRRLRGSWPFALVNRRHLVAVGGHDGMDLDAELGMGSPFSV